MRVLRLIRGVTQCDRVRNERVRGDLGVKSILEIIEKNQLRWFGHVKRMRPGGRFERVMEWRPDGRGPVGRLRKRWMDSMEEAVRRREGTMDEVETTSCMKTKKGGEDSGGEAPDRTYPNRLDGEKG